MHQGPLMIATLRKTFVQKLSTRRWYKNFTRKMRRGGLYAVEIHKNLLPNPPLIKADRDGSIKADEDG